MNEVIQFSDPIIKQEGITLSVKYTDGEPCISGDEEMLKQVFLNILLNSIQAMPDGGALDIETIVSHKSTDSSVGDGNVEIRISDTGVGISKEDLKRIFDPFFSTREKGSGLGLAIVHNIIHIHGGSIDVENREKRGTTFSIILPLIGETS
jgi:signal transduction histidine kinase